MIAPVHDASQVFIELGAAIVGLALLARLANRLGFSAIPLYLLLGLAFGNGGLAPLNVSEEFIRVGAEIGVLLLLFMLGLEYTGEELMHHLRTGLPSGAVDFALNFPPGLITGLLLGWSPLASVLLGGVTYISSSGVIAKVLTELERLNNPETPSVISVLVLEDLAMAVYLPLIGVLLAGGGARKVAFSVSVAIGTVGLILLIALRYGRQLSKFFLHESDEIILLTILGAVVLVGAWPSACGYQRRSERFWSALRCPVRSRRSHGGCWAHFAICLPRSSFSFSDYKLTRKCSPVRCP